MNPDWRKSSCRFKGGGVKRDDIATLPQTEILPRMVVEETADELLIVTLYKTSKFKKCEPGSPP